ncbi:hypothetical protein [Acuticoccus sediminis]|nr:hypothetical protein [Acuticoccus sediminis]
MSEMEPAPREGEALASLRKADVWTGLVLAVVAAAMVAKALTFPLAGTYAGVKNAWYVSPALFPLMVGGMLFALSAGLVARALRDYRALRPDGHIFGVSLAVAGGRDAVLIAGLLAAYIVGLVPRTDFVVATALFLLVFMGVYVIASRTGRTVLVALIALPSVLALAVAVGGGWPAPRSGGQFTADGALAVVLAAAALAFAAFARGEERRRIVPVLASAAGTSVVLSAVFKYGLLVPLPREGAGVFLMDGVADRIAALFG